MNAEEFNLVSNDNNANFVQEGGFDEVFPE